MFNPNKIRQLLEQNKVTQIKLSQDLKISKSNFYVWFSGEAIPGVDKLEMIADYFNVPIDYFFDRNTCNKCDISETGPEVSSDRPDLLSVFKILEEQNVRFDKEFAKRDAQMDRLIELLENKITGFHK